MKFFTKQRQVQNDISHISHPSLIDPGARILDSQLQGPISIGYGSYVEKSVLYGPISIGRFTSFNGPNSDIHTHNEIEIGSFCSISRNVSIQNYGHNHKKITTYFILCHVFNEDYREETIQGKPSIRIGHDVWIAAQCVLLNGALIGNGAVIGANSVVNSPIPDYAIAVGSPARVIGYRFSKEIIQRLTNLEWWNWPLDKITRNRQLFTQELTMEMLDRIQE